MADVLTKKQRSFNMSRIRSRNTKPEITIRKKLYQTGLRNYRLHYKLPGKPDIVYPRGKIAIFVDGCFWHKCPKCFVKPSSNIKFWEKKIASNTSRDKRISQLLKAEGWGVIRFWEHDIKNNLNACCTRVQKRLKNSRYGGR